MSWTREDVQQLFRRASKARTPVRSIIDDVVADDPGLERREWVGRMESGSWRGSDTAWWPVLLLTRATRQPSVVGESVMLRALARETREQSCALRGEAVQIRTRARAAARRRVSERTDCEAASPRSPGTGQTG